MYINSLDTTEISRFMVTDKKLYKMNDKCGCGSNLKYKKCCY